MTRYTSGMPGDPLKDIRIAAPCPASWEGMAGDERVRHCTLCSLNVYNFREMKRDEIRALLDRTEGRVCARLYRRADGTLLTSDCPSGFQVLRQRMSRFAAAVTAAFFTVSAFASDGATCEKPRVRKHGSKVKFTTEQLATAQQAELTGVVLDESGRNPIPGVTVMLRDEAMKRELTTVTDVNGAFTFASLSDGIYRVEVMLSGFKSAVVEHLVLKQSEIMRARVALRAEVNETITVGAVGPDSTMMDAGVTTTFSQSLINKLPH
ncbi:MAG: hypothetical protein JWO97_1510 [Acidobacteria bacterium]|nr:hypothetical protein [Acidobacteriota bacterium]